MTNLNAVNIGMNKFCGPAVLSILTGKSTDECARVISSINGKYNIEGVQLNHLLEAASRLGFDQVSIPASSSLFGTLTRLVNNDGLYIVTLQKHFVVIEVNDKKIYFCDNHTKEPMPAASSARLQQRVIAVHKVFKRREPIQVSIKLLSERRCQTDGSINLHIYQQITYDIQQFDRTVQVTWLKFANEQELNEFKEKI